VATAAAQPRFTAAAVDFMAVADFMAAGSAARVLLAR
jgi:hypothetical protein